MLGDETQGIGLTIACLETKSQGLAFRGRTMKVEALTMFSKFSDPIHRTRNVLKDHHGKPVIPERPPQEKKDLSEAEHMGCGVDQFVPYSSQLPWHTGSRGFLSKLFPRYGNYCGPNWSSGREIGSLVWDEPPIDALDFCCYKHDIGYDSYRQEDLYKADLVFLKCLERTPREGERAGNFSVSEFYRGLYIFGLRTVLIPYRKFLIEKVDPKTRKTLTEKEIFSNDRTQ